VLDLDSSGALTSLSQITLARSLLDTVAFFQKRASEIIIDYGVVEAPNEVLIVGEPVSLDELRKSGLGVLAPDAALTGKRPGGAASWAHLERGPYWCTDAVPL
jgi:hypothetical protein